jgi:ubiquinone/menaquinone biosynthesis C-methylase UbiE/DNA-binding transcriptional ArsR family regulator
MISTLDESTAFCRLLSDPTRVRLLRLLEAEELTVAELTVITSLAQSRVSTHLAKLREPGLLRDRKAGVSTFYAFNEGALNPAQQALWTTLRDSTDDSVLAQDRKQLVQVLKARSGEQSWADSVAGDMRRHYSPGRTFEATARTTLGLLNLGKVIDLASGDGALAEIIAPNADSVDCFDISQKVISAATKRLARLPNVHFAVGDMHQIAAADNSYDQALLMHALTYTKQPEKVAAEIFRVLAPGGTVAVATLNKHAHKQITEPFNHVNSGYGIPQLSKIFSSAGFTIQQCEITSREQRTPQFEVITLIALKPSNTPS